MTPFPQDITNPSSLSTFTFPLRPRPNGGSSSSGGCSGGGHYHTIIQQFSGLTIGEYQTPHGDRHVETRHQEQQVVQTTTTTTTTTSRTTATGPRHENMDRDRDRDILLNPVSSSSAVMGPQSPIHNCSSSSSSCSDFSTVASKTATRARTSRHSQPASSISISEVSSESGATGGGPSPNLKKYLRTRRGAISGPSCPGPAPGPSPLSLALSPPSPALSSRSSWRSSSSRPSRSRAYGGERLLLPAPSMSSGSFTSSGLGSEMSSGTTGSRAGGRTGNTTGVTTTRLSEARLFPFSLRGWPDHNRNGSQIITDPTAFSDSSSAVSNESSSSVNTVHLLDLHTSPPPPPPSASLRTSASRLSQNPRIRTGEITPEDSISQIGSSASASALPSTIRRNRGQRSSLSLPIRNLPLRGVRCVSATEVELLPHIRLEEEDRWILPSSTPGRFGPPPLSAFGSGSSRDSSLRGYRQVVIGSSRCPST
ncbi:hypothetical protein NCU01880 [Neurospora crassa OR74A]|uniref:Uncharacterized protein n=2 Tax=Neurospora crassa TaxID=5141 RepID=Q7SHC6_NEUCR|nr:hypothetical protein NCU01880 [Neurospora crassa OR74A]EAA36275.1 hypothetical protein NCU01880 [Neurospora crassa OR74A]CAE81980.1 hypothetical protein [Neurospora crassa]|eukprot:XP_965511.1 hypothetical protein NCU01880 [Neurospora crassa OR74A]